LAWPELAKRIRTNVDQLVLGACVWQGSTYVDAWDSLCYAVSGSLTCPALVAPQGFRPCQGFWCRHRARLSYSPSVQHRMGVDLRPNKGNRQLCVADPPDHADEGSRERI
jgi:hypothetical protein